MIDESSWCLDKNNHTLHHGPPNVLANVNCALKKRSMDEHKKSSFYARAPVNILSLRYTRMWCFLLQYNHIMIIFYT